MENKPFTEEFWKISSKKHNSDSKSAITTAELQLIEQEMSEIQHLEFKELK